MKNVYVVRVSESSSVDIFSNMKAAYNHIVNIMDVWGLPESVQLSIPSYPAFCKTMRAHEYTTIYLDEVDSNGDQIKAWGYFEVDTKEIKSK